MKVDRVGVHISHCCKRDGCKYMDDNCPVVSGKVRQENICEDCEIAGIKNVDEIDYWDSDLRKLENIYKNIDLPYQIDEDILCGKIIMYLGTYAHRNSTGIEFDIETHNYIGLDTPLEYRLNER
jgi:hypothetical protein